MFRGYKRSLAAARSPIPCDPTAGRMACLLLLVLAALGEEFLGLRSLGRLNTAKESGELLLGHLVAAQQRLKGVAQEHLDTDQFGEDVRFHCRRPLIG